MAEQLKSAIEEFNELHPNCTGVFCFDQSSNHSTMPNNALNAFKMNLGPGGKQIISHDTGYYDANGQWRIQRTVDGDGRARGLEAVLKERCLWPEQGLKKMFIKQYLLNAAETGKSLTLQNFVNQNTTLILSQTILGDDFQSDWTTRFAFVAKELDLIVVLYTASPIKQHVDPIIKLLYLKMNPNYQLPVYLDLSQVVQLPVMDLPHVTQLPLRHHAINLLHVLYLLVRLLCLSSIANGFKT
ncbi:hypothetical protein BDB00DRAFT_872083 [Zychaea mexicana]|uniref:uncharacterized protein n=1 Tax=Zychaea mexicana TaxID=64656 RepID=UPI0022FEF9EB|nr:uncharacterized protein BDB00DRAFT_872083 [Zychaea mexicana]KAI9493620.1 hypothetical protein BDB00DRAFT_872083 [Zychaea mexicana]